MINEYSYFTPAECTDRAFALAEFLTGCRAKNISIKKVNFFQAGFQVVFELGGDAILHDNSYGRFDNEWETYECPWDYGDVSVHDAKTLLTLLEMRQNGEDWEKWLNEGN